MFSEEVEVSRRPLASNDEAIVYEAYGQEERPIPPRDESKPSKEELEWRMSVLLPTKSPDRES